MIGFTEARSILAVSGQNQGKTEDGRIELPSRGILLWPQKFSRSERASWSSTYFKESFQLAKAFVNGVSACTAQERSKMRRSTSAQ